MSTMPNQVEVDLDDKVEPSAGVPAAEPAPVALVPPAHMVRHAVDPIEVPKPYRGARYAAHLALAPATAAGGVAGWVLGLTWPTLLVTLVATVAAVVASRSRVRTAVLPDWSSIALGRLAAALLAALGALAAIGTIVQEPVTDAQLVVLGLVPLLALPTRALVLRKVRRPSKVLVLGDAEALAAAKTMNESPEVEIVAALGVGKLDEVEGLDLDRLGFQAEALSSLAHVAGRASALGADTVLVFPSARLGAIELRELTWMLERSQTRLLMAGLPWGTATHRVEVAKVADLTAVEVLSSRPGLGHRSGKMLLDRVAGAALLALAAPVFAVCAIAIRLESPGSPFFKQVRIGREGVPFTMYKLRTMYVDAEERLAALKEINQGHGLLFKLKHDPRVTKPGRILRKLSLDELPQLINVVRGEMALVGPRPALAREVAQYDELLWRRLAVQPGMTGLWQVSGRSDLSQEDSLRLDLEYVDNWTVGGDLAIGARTFSAVLTARGAY